MAIGGFQKKLPLSAAMRPGGFGTVPPPGVSGASRKTNLGSIKAPVAAKAPKAPGLSSMKISGMPKMPVMPKMPKFR